MIILMYMNLHSSLPLQNTIDADGNGSLDMEEFAEAYKKINPDVSLIQLEAMFNEADIDGNGTLDLEEVR